MAQLNEQELQDLRHMIGAHETTANKLETYAQQCQDQKLKQMLQDDAKDAKQSRQKLLNFLN